jgi:hypothetical protein
MLATPDEEMAGTMSFASLIDAIAGAMEQWSNIVHLLLKRFLKTVTFLLKHSLYFASISILLVMENFLAVILYSCG